MSWTAIRRLPPSRSTDRAPLSTDRWRPPSTDQSGDRWIGRASLSRHRERHRPSSSSTSSAGLAGGSRLPPGSRPPRWKGPPMSDNAAQRPDSADTGRALARRTLPIGARYPRSWPDSVTSAGASTPTPNVRHAHLPPVGCRFPGAGQVEYSEPVPSVRSVPGPPVGARFPRSSAWHSEALMESTLFV